jgi:hypothetical protein
MNNQPAQNKHLDYPNDTYLSLTQFLLNQSQLTQPDSSKNNNNERILEYPDSLPELGPTSEETSDDDSDHDIIDEHRTQQPASSRDSIYDNEGVSDVD